MFIYLITRNDPADYDQYAGFVIQAGTRDMVRQAAQMHDPDDPVWMNADKSSIQMIGTAQSTVVSHIWLADFRAG